MKQHSRCMSACLARTKNLQVARALRSIIVGRSYDGRGDDKVCAKAVLEEAHTTNNTFLATACVPAVHVHCPRRVWRGHGWELFRGLVDAIQCVALKITSGPSS